MPLDSDMLIWVAVGGEDSVYQIHRRKEIVEIYVVVAVLKGLGEIQHYLGGYPDFTSGTAKGLPQVDVVVRDVPCF